MYWIATRTLPPVKFDPCAVSFIVEVAYQAVGPTTPLLLDPVDFMAMYQDKVRQMQAQGQPPSQA